MPRISVDLFRGSALSLASQGVGVLQLLALIWRVGATEATDAYFYLFSIGLLPTQILTVGLMYPLLLSDQRISQAGVRKLRMLLPALALGAVTLGGCWLATADRLERSLLPIVLLSGINAAVQALLWQRAICAAASGNPNWEAAVALPANVLATIVVAISWLSPTATVVGMLAALVIGNGFLLVVAIQRDVGAEAISSLPLRGTSGWGASGWFLAKSGTGYGGLAVLQSLAVLLPASAVTWLAVITKLVGSVSASMINAVMPRFVHQTSLSPMAGRRFIRIAVALCAPVGAVIVVVVGELWPQQRALATVALLWLASSMFAAAAQRMAFRFLPPRASIASLSVIPVIVGAAIVSSSADGFSLVTLVCAYAAIDALVGTFLNTALRDRVMAGIATFVAIGLGSAWIFSL